MRRAPDAEDMRNAAGSYAFLRSTPYRPSVNASELRYENDHGRFEKFGITGMPPHERTSYWSWYIFAVPFHYSVLALGVLPLCTVANWAYRRRREKMALLRGCCPKYRYDLRMHKPGQRCPECGWTVSKSG